MNVDNDQKDNEKLDFLQMTQKCCRPIYSGIEIFEKKRTSAVFEVFLQ